MTTAPLTMWEWCLWGYAIAMTAVNIVLVEIVFALWHRRERAGKRQRGAVTELLK